MEIDMLEALKSYIKLDKREIIFSALEGNPSLKIINEDEDLNIEVQKNTTYKREMKANSEKARILIQQLQCNRIEGVSERVQEQQESENGRVEASKLTENRWKKRNYEMLV